MFPWSAYVLLGAVALALARRHRRMTLALHAVCYALGAAIASGLLTTATLAIVSPAAATTGPPGAASFAALAMLFAVLVFPVGNTRERWPGVMPVARCVTAAVVVWTASGAFVAGILTVLPGALDASQLSTIKTLVLVGAAVAAAAAAVHPSGREAAWLTYPVLLIAGMKLVFVDFMQGRPTTLFAALAVYGAALIVAPRMLRRQAAPAEAGAVPLNDVAALTSTRPQTIAR